jgi:hypothetical protein
MMGLGAVAIPATKRKFKFVNAEATASDYLEESFFDLMRHWIGCNILECRDCDVFDEVVIALSKKWKE